MVKRTVKQKWGLVFASIACVLFWVPLYETHRYFLRILLRVQEINLLPSLASGLFAMIIVFLLYIRGILVFKPKKLKLVSLLINWTLFSTFIEILISPFANNNTYSILKDNALLVLLTIAFIVVLLCGVKEIAKICLLIFLCGSFFSNLLLVSDAMGFWGFLALAFVLVSFYLQGNIDIKALKGELNYLYCKN